MSGLKRFVLFKGFCFILTFYILLNDSFVYAGHRKGSKKSQKSNGKSLRKRSSISQSNKQLIPIETSTIEKPTTVVNEIPKEEIIVQEALLEQPVIEDKNEEKESESEIVFKDLKKKYISSKLAVHENCWGLSLSTDISFSSNQELRDIGSTISSSGIGSVGTSIGNAMTNVAGVKDAKSLQTKLENLKENINNCKTKVSKLSKVLDKMGEREDDYDLYERFIIEGGKIIRACGKIDVSSLEKIAKRAKMASNAQTIGAIAGVVGTFAAGAATIGSFTKPDSKVTTGLGIAASVASVGSSIVNMASSILGNSAGQTLNTVNMQIINCENTLN